MNMRLTQAPIDTLCANALRFLAIDAVEAAKSGHPGMPMGMAEIAVALWTRHLKHDPTDPAWADRDRFVLSNGHGSMLLYALLHLSGYDLPVAELKRFRQLDSRTPGHPEVGHTPGVETTTGRSTKARRTGHFFRSLRHSPCGLGQSSPAPQPPHTPRRPWRLADGHPPFPL